MLVLISSVIAPDIHSSILPCFQPSSFLTAGEVNEKRELSPVAMIPAVGLDSLQSGSSDVTADTARGEVSGGGDASPVFIRNHLHRFS